MAGMSGRCFYNHLIYMTIFLTSMEAADGAARVAVELHVIVHRLLQLWLPMP
jgi:hypothetical protein